MSIISNMKKIKYIYICSMIGLLAVASCKKNSLLDQLPPTVLTDANFWNTTSNLQSYMNNLYQTLPHITGYNIGIFSADNTSDNLVAQVPDARLAGLYTVAGNSGYADWTNIRNANYFLANYSRVKDTRANINPYVGEAYFFRAMLYFNGLRNYGALPWINTPLNVNDTAQLYAARLPRNVVADSIVKDLDSAITYLPTKGSAQAMRLYKEYAAGFKARVCLYEGTWEKYHANDVFGVAGQDGANFLQLAADAANMVMTSGLFKIDNVGVPNGYLNLFNQTDYSGSKEVMFWGAYNQQQGVVDNVQNYYQFGSDGTYWTGLSKTLVDDYLCADGKPIGLSPLYQGDDSLKHIFANRDPRLRQTVFFNGDTVIKNQPGANPIKTFTYPALTSSYVCTSGFQLKKGLNTDFNQDSHNGPGGTDGMIIMRYAEILLVYAEARAELGAITQSDVDLTINLLRDRVGMPHLNISSIPADPNWNFPELSPVVNEVRRERRVEFSCEGYRLDDILRWAAAPNVIIGKLPIGARAKQFLTVIPSLTIGTNLFVNTQGYISPYANVASMSAGYQFKATRDYLLPLSLQETTVNPATKQNPGW
jgi:hypothetical protein